MRDFTKKTLGLCGMMLTTALGAQAAIEAPAAISPETLTHGGKYVLINPANPNGYHSRTSWDGALYFLGPKDSNFANHAMEAVQNEDGTWSFVQTAEDGTKKFMLLPEGNANINMGDSAVWSVEKGAMEGYYWLKAGDGNNSNAVGLYMHLNAGQQYFVISYNGGPWYPDYAVKTDEEGFNILDEATGNWQMADSTSLNWGFVTVENLQKYADKKSAYDAIVAYDTTYCKQIVDYAAGFELGCQAAEAIYNNEAFDGTYLDSINAILNAKVALYNKILATIDENISGDATLGAAIAAAIDVFDATAKADELNAEIKDLDAAIAAFQQGLGDYTSLGVNMSFEDLSAQNGSQTSGICAATPVGWNLYLNDVLCVTADELRAAGLGAWCGVNNDCAGEAKDGEVGFGIWNQGMPKVELSQTITGLENGTYEISAAVMVGANGSGSRLTTQRIFGNLNSTYFGSDYDYNKALLDNNEVYDFAGLIEPVTDRDMQPMTVRAYVYDGTLTFGFRTDNRIAAANRTQSNGAGGDGWFKVDNFRIRKVGYENKDALAVLQHFVDILDGYYYENMGIYVGIVEELEQTLEQFEDLDDNTPVEDINAGIHTAIALMERVQPYMDAYAELAEAIAVAYEGLAEYGHMPGAVAFKDVIEEIEENLAEGVYDIDGVAESIARLEVALEECKKSEINVGMDISNLIANRSFEDMTSQPGGDTGGVADAPKGWTLILNGDTCMTAADVNAQGISAWCAINSGDAIKVGISETDTIYKQPTDGEKLWGIWNSDIPEVELSQVITGLPMGTYTLTADVMVENNWAGNNITTQRIFGNDCVQMFSSDGNHELNLPADAIAARDLDNAYPMEGFAHLTYAEYSCPVPDEDGNNPTSLLRPMKVSFCVGESGEARIGFRTNGVNTEGLTYAEGGRNGQGWFKVDNFRLTYDAETVCTGIEEVVAGSADATVVSRQYFTADGVQIAAPAQGINVVVETLSNGQVKVSKLLK